MESLTWIAGDASEYVFYDYQTYQRRGVLEIEGFGLPELEHTSQAYPFLHGMLDIARRFRDRRVQISFWQNWDTRALWQAGRNEIRNALNPDLGKGQLKFIDASGNDWRLDAWLLNAPLPRSGKWTPVELHAVLEFWVPDPMWHKAAAETANDDFNDATPVDINISNDGNLGTPPTTITLEAGGGEQIKNPVLTIVGTGAKIDIDNTIAAGETVTITCWPPEDVVVTKDGTSILGDLSYDSTLIGFSLPRGNSVVRIVGEATSDGNCFIQFFERFLAV